MKNMTREETITNMCYKLRHDYGLERIETDFPFGSGMTQSERLILWNQMAEIYDAFIAPLKADK